MLLHQDAKSYAAATMGKPFERSSSPSPRSSLSARRSSGMFVRGRVFYLRVRVPRGLQQGMGRTHIWRSLKTANMTEAVRRARIAGAEIETLLLNAEGIVPSTISVHQLQHGAAEVRKGTSAEHSLRRLFDLFINDPAKDRARRTRLALEGVAAIVYEVWGQDTPVKTINRDACRQLLDTLRWLPTNAAKRYPKLSVLKAVHLARENRLTTVLSATTVNAYLNILSMAFNFAVNEGWIDRNPAKGLRLIDPIRKRDKRLPFSPAQLVSIFNAPLFRGCMNDGAGYADPGPEIIRRSRFWAPLIALYAGMRANEILQLDTADIRTIDDVACFVVSSRSENGAEDKKVKTRTSERAIPVHPRLVTLGFLSFVAGRRREGGAKLFIELSASSTGYYSDPFSKWFARFLRRANAYRPKTCFHSFRHCFRDALRDARIDHDLSLALGGWASASGRDGGETAEVYGRGFRMNTLYEALRKIEYPMLDLTHLNADLTG
jgi:integrase